MTHYVLMDNHSGFIWGEADASDPVEACIILDQQLGSMSRTYDTVSSFGGDDRSGYHVFEAPADWEQVEDGRSGTEIDRVESLCRKIACVEFTTIE